MKKNACLVLFLVMLVFINSCHETEIESERTLKSNEGNTILIKEAENWYNENTDNKNYPILEYADELQWNRAIFHDVDTAVFIEIPIKLKTNFETRIKDDNQLNVTQRLLIVYKENRFSSLLELIISDESKDNLHNIKKINYSYQKDGFIGTFLLVNSAGDIVKVKQVENKETNVNVSLKSVQVTCVALVYKYSDGSYDIVSILYCYDVDTGTSNSGGSTSVPPNIDPDDCNCNICLVCGGCIDALKSIPIPPDDSGDTEETNLPCPMCTCSVAPVVDATALQENPKADCIYQNLLDGEILQDFIARYYAPSEPNQSFLGELNLTWTLGSTAETLPIGVPNNGTYYSVEIRLNESAINSSSVTNVAISILHEALHAKLIAEFYDQEGTTDFLTLYANYKGQDLLGIDKEQEKIMLETYFEDLAIGLRDFDYSQGIYKTLDFYKKSVRYDLIYEIYGEGSSQEDYNAYLELINSSKNCY